MGAAVRVGIRSASDVCSTPWQCMAFHLLVARWRGRRQRMLAVLVQVAQVDARLGGATRNLLLV
eukprot:296534-Prorocentrum_lima.AAC.1